ncbi:hypothetical protein MYSTI_01934 [Myxococcus stipitatus DSM 14675]|uniref:Uncharacterized protein n=1 Tax=Myxococcus stipitatus (strain DSM 14675 / JCM 12634 / Mx s8) TaxID=1278073 RepID=L7U5Y1_MYXSD|nr:hypothetical protein MYSTI_01934 [Myxococcus stipitatus DSM 14675]
MGHVDSDEPLSIRAYAKHRGCSHVAVLKAIKRGRLVKSITPDKKVIPSIADREWIENTDLTRAPQRAPEIQVTAVIPPEPAPSAPPVSINDAALRQKHWQAQLAELKYRKAAGELVEVAQVRHHLEDVFRQCRTRLLGLPTRIKQGLPHLTVADHALVDAYIREVLEQLAAGEALP